MVLAFCLFLDDASESMNYRSSPLAQKLKAIATKLSSIVGFSFKSLTNSVASQGGSYYITSYNISPAYLCFLLAKALLQRKTLNFKNSSVITGTKVEGWE